MPLKEFFLSHFHGDELEIGELATELRVRGIAPWVDKQRGGFSVGDESAVEARRVIREDCFGFLFYATGDAFKSHFIKEIEIHEAHLMRLRDPNYVLFAIARETGFSQLQRMSLDQFGIDISAYHGVSIGSKEANLKILKAKWAETAFGVLDRHVSGSGAGRDTLSLQISTRDLFPDQPNDLLRIDGTQLFTTGVDVPQTWERLLLGLVDVKNVISRFCARPRLYIHGSKHLTAAFMIGRIFAPFSLDIQQTRDQIWTSDAPWSNGDLFNVTIHPGDTHSAELFVEVASRHKDIAAGVDAFIAQKRLLSPTRLNLVPFDGPLDVDNSICRAMVRQTYREVERVMRGKSISAIHLFVAAPQALMIMLGQEFKGMPPVHLYEWTGTGYERSCVIPGGVL